MQIVRAFSQLTTRDHQCICFLWCAPTPNSSHTPYSYTQQPPTTVQRTKITTISLISTLITLTRLPRLYLSYVCLLYRAHAGGHLCSQGGYPRGRERRSKLLSLTSLTLCWRGKGCWISQYDASIRTKSCWIKCWFAQLLLGCWWLHSRFNERSEGCNSVVWIAYTWFYLTKHLSFCILWRFSFF